jgi:hypothetical protein
MHHVIGRVERVAHGGFPLALALWRGGKQPGCERADRRGDRQLARLGARSSAAHTVRNGCDNGRAAIQHQLGDRAGIFVSSPLAAGIGPLGISNGKRWALGHKPVDYGVECGVIIAPGFVVSAKMFLTCS